MLTDAIIARKSRRIKALEAKMATLKSEAEELKGEILHELEHRGTKGLETHGLRITYVAPVRSSYDSELLQRKLGPRRWALVTKPTLDKDLLAAAIAEGKIRSSTVADCVTETPVKPYILINPAEPEG